MPAFGALLKLAKPAKVLSFGARSGGVGSFASAGACKPSVIPVDGRGARSPPAASLMGAGRRRGGESPARGKLDAIRRGQRRALVLDRPFELVAAARLFGREGGSGGQQ